MGWDAVLAQRGDGLDDVLRLHRTTVRGAAVELEVLLDLALALALGRLVDRELDLPLAVLVTFDMESAEYSVEMSSSERWVSCVKPSTRA